MEDTICFVVMDLIRILMYVSTLVWQIIGLSLSLSLSLSLWVAMCVEVHGCMHLSVLIK